MGQSNVRMVRTWRAVHRPGGPRPRGRVASAALLLLLLGCAPVQAPPPDAAPPPPHPVAASPASHTAPDTASDTAAPARARPTPYPVPLAPEFRAAIEAGTRTERGEPGPSYWQQWAEYDIRARLDTEARALSGSQTVRYHNRSPDPLTLLVVNLTQNYHAPGVERVRPAEVTGGKTIERVLVDGVELAEVMAPGSAGWRVDGTLMYLVLPAAVPAGGAVELGVDWSFLLPQAGAGGRMGYSGDELFYLGYWYPHLAVYDDAFGWHAEPFRGNAEFYSNFARYDVAVDVPAGWLVASTGRLVNEAEVLAPEVIQRLRRAAEGDEVVRVVDHGGARAATAPAPDGRLVWRFEADSVRDVSFAVMREHAWDVTRSPVGDRTGDGETDHARIDVFWREGAVHYPEAARYARHSIDFLSRFTGLPYPWPHMTVVEGGGIIGGGMEYPMITIVGDFNIQGPRALYRVIAHEIAHMWVPMILSTNERRYTWLDEGVTVFNENYARLDMFPDQDPFRADQDSYLRAAILGREGPIMRWSDFHYPGPAYGVASYPKPAAVLYALQGVLGQETFVRAMTEFYRRWAFRHPYPWDLWNTIEDVSGRDLGWFWRSWFHESTEDGEPWVLNQAVESVRRLPSGETLVVVRDHGWIPMPVHLTVTREDGQVVESIVPVDSWLLGADLVEVTIPAGPRVVRVEIDAAGWFPDANRGNRVWSDG